MRHALMIALLGAGLAAPAFGADAPVAVQTGGDEMSDACPSLGEVAGLKVDGDNFLAVRTGPGTRFRESDRIATGARVALCDERGPWLGIVYAPGGDPADCDVATPKPRREAYPGPCRSGWVHSRFVTVIAG